MYTNPIINRDYSDPDVCEVDGIYYMVASSFNFVPGLPILRSTDLINWEIINYALKELPKEYDTVQPGKGVWAPSIRYHNGEYLIFIPFPDEGIYVARGKDICGEFSFSLLNKTKGMIDPCPIWINDEAYCVVGFAKSRIGFNSKIGIFKMDVKAEKTLNDYVIIFDGTNTQPTIEGPKIYYINDYFYILAPAGSVTTGWQTCLRAKNIMGPYEEKIVMMQGDKVINGPHQGALIANKDEYWFLHFSDRNHYGRVICLEPVTWLNDWPIIGEVNGEVGTPYEIYKKPNLPVSKKQKYNAYFKDKLDLYWQLPANNKNYYEVESSLKLYGVKAENLFMQPNSLLQMVEYENFFVKTDIEVLKGYGGLIVYGKEYLAFGIKDKILYLCDKEIEYVGSKVFLKLFWNKGLCTFAYSTDNKKYIRIKDKYYAKKGYWTGTKIGLFMQGKKEEFLISNYFEIKKR